MEYSIFVSSFNSIGTNSTFGFETPFQRNVISGNGDVGIYIGNPISTGNVVAGNYVGTTPSGVGPLGNRGGGIRLDQGATGNIIGGLNGTERNVLAANLFHGISLDRSASGQPHRRELHRRRRVRQSPGQRRERGPDETFRVGQHGRRHAADAANVIAFNQVDGIDIGVGHLGPERRQFDPGQFDLRQLRARHRPRLRRRDPESYRRCDQRCPQWPAELSGPELGG